MNSSIALVDIDVGIANAGLDDNMFTCLRVHSSFSSLVQSLLPKDSLLRTYSIDLI